MTHQPSLQEPKRSNTTEIVKKLGQMDLDEQEWLVLTPKDKLPQPKVTSFPRPKQRADGSFIFVAPDSVTLGPSSGPGGPGGTDSGGGGGKRAMLYKKRAYEDVTATATQQVRLSIFMTFPP